MIATRQSIAHRAAFRPHPPTISAVAGRIETLAGRRLRRRPLATRLAAVAIATIVAAGSGWVAVAASSGTLGAEGGVVPPAAAPPANAAVSATDYTTADSRRILGTDGRLTVLLLGSDSRPSHPGIRTDTIMVVSVDPVTGKAAAVSIPRDTINFPLSATKKFPQKLNALYAVLAKKSKNPGGQLRSIVGKALGIEIDAYALIGFKGVTKLIDRVGGLNVTVAKTFYDPTYWVTPRRRGWGLKKGVHHLAGKTALIFARSRHGDSDYARARRQQQLVMAASAKVEARGALALAALVATSKGLVKTDLPMSEAPLIFDIVSQADLVHAKRTVFGPRTYASAAGGFNNILKMAVCKSWIKANFPPKHMGNAWLPPAPPTLDPTPTPTPDPTPTPTPDPTPTT